MRLIAIAEVALLAQSHLRRLAPGERRRLVQLVRRGRGMSAPEREELRALIQKLDVRAFAGSAVSHLSPVRIPKRFTRSRS
jgi:hypothetical protein